MTLNIVQTINPCIPHNSRSTSRFCTEAFKLICMGKSMKCTKLMTHLMCHIINIKIITKKRIVYCTLKRMSAESTPFGAITTTLPTEPALPFLHLWHKQKDDLYHNFQPKISQCLLSWLFKSLV